MKVPHVDREFSFGNRHSKMSTPKDFLNKIENHRALVFCVRAQGSFVTF